MLQRMPKRCFSSSLRAYYKVAIVGAGPAGFYTAHHLLNKAKHLSITIDFFDRLPTPYGLSRYGVAPDHPEVKNCENYMINLWRDFSEKVRFFGNVNVGSDISLSQLKSHYNSIVLSYGCTASDNKLEIPGSDHPSVMSARQFVNWYNGHPDSKQNNEYIPPLAKIRTVTIIGNGNVAIDIARVLLADPESHWSPTDITSEAVELLSRSNVQQVNIVARRGLLESAFTNKEIRELLEISKKSNIRFLPIGEETLAPLRERAKLLSRVEKRKFTILDKASSIKDNLTEPKKEWCLKFLMSPKRFVVSEKDSDLLKCTLFEINELHEDSSTQKVTVKGTGREIEVENDLVILSIGYKGQTLEGFESVNLEFSSKKNQISNIEGRVLKNDPVEIGNEDCITEKGWYASGWIKNGPKGVIASTMMDSFDTAEKILEDLSNEIFISSAESSDITKKLPPNYVSWSGWQAIDGYELQNGETKGKTREKVRNVSEMLRIANGND